MMMMKDAAEGRIALSDVPSVKRWNDEYFKLPPVGKRTADRWTGHDVHHAVETWIQKDYLNLSGGYDDVPGWVLNTKDHTFGKDWKKEGTLYGDLEAAVEAAAFALPTGPEKAREAIRAMREVYQRRGLDDLWAVTKEWLVSKGFVIPPQ